MKRLQEARKEKGYSHENMAHERHISLGAYTNLKKNGAKLTAERLIKIVEVLEKPIYYFIEANPNNIYNQNFKNHSVGEHIENLYQENKETCNKLTETYKTAIQNLKDEVAFSRELVQAKS